MGTAWGVLKGDKRAARARELLEAGDREGLWALVLHHLTTWGRAGARTSRNTERAYRAGLNAFLDYLAGLGLSGSDLAAVALEPGTDLGAEYLRHLERKGLSPGTVNNRRAAAAAFYRALRWTGATTADPFSDVPAVRDPTPRHEKRQPYSAAEVRALVAAATPHERVMVLLGAQAGLRVSEITALTWDTVDLKAKKLRVTGKGGKTGTVGIPKGLLAALDALEPRAGYVVPWRRAQTVRERLERLCERAGVRYLGVHSLRHHAGTEVYRKTRNLDAAAKQLRHSQIATSAIYAKWSEDLMGNVLEEWD